MGVIISMLLHTHMYKRHEAVQNIHYIGGLGEKRKGKGQAAAGFSTFSRFRNRLDHLTLSHPDGA